MGSYLFHANNPEGIKISNWQDIKDELIIKLTQTIHSFREVYVVTESASASNWTLAIAGASKAELELVSEDEDFGLVNIFSEQSTQTINSKDIEYYNRETSRKPNFFKAKKLIVRDDKKEMFISEFIKNNVDEKEWLQSFFDSNLDFDSFIGTSRHSNIDQINLLDMLQVNQLNPNTALSYFTWTNINLDDIEKLFS